MGEKRWKPKNGEMYWYVWNDVACWSYFTWNLDERRFKFGNCFKTEEEAEAAAEKVKVLLLSLHDNGNNIATNLQDKKLPKLTAEVFDRPDCPYWAKYAAVDKCGMAFYYQDFPTRLSTFFLLSNQNGKSEEIKGKFNNHEWYNSLIERPVKLPDWCKVGEWVYYPEEMEHDVYLKISEIKRGFVHAKEKDGYDPWQISYKYIGEYGKPARLRPYNAEEIPDLPFEVTERNSNFRTTVVSCNGDKVWLGGASTAISTEELMRDFTAKGNPCGVLEHIENGEWVR